MTTQAVLTRVREAKGLDRELDRDLFWRFDPVQSGICFANGSMGMPRPLDHGQPIPAGLGRLGVEVSAPLYTASIDAAVGLVERVRPGCGWDLHLVRGNDPECEAELWPHAGGHFSDAGATPALALLAALLSSLIAQEAADANR